MKTLFTLLIISLLMTGCLAPKTQQVKLEETHVEEERLKQQELALQYLHRLNLRLAETAFPLLQAATVFCEEQEDQIPAIGMLSGSEFDYQEEFRDVAKSLFGVGQHLQVMHVIPNSPAEQAGILAGDRLLSINEQQLPDDKTAAERLREILGETSTATFPLTVERNGQTIKLDVTNIPACDNPVILSESDAVNAYADGSRVVITKGMMRFTENDQELSLVISHELAHNVMSHIKAKTINSLGGTLLDIAAAAAGVNTQGLFGKMAAQAYSQEFESEADYVGLYIMTRAGVKTDDAAMFWRRMAVEHPGSIHSNHASTHPATAERFIAIEKTLEQIEHKKTQGMALLPDMKE